MIMRARIVIAVVVIVPVLYLLARPSSRAAPRATSHAATVRARSEPSESKASLQREIERQEQARAKVSARLAELEGRLNELEQAEPPPGAQAETPRARVDVGEADIASWLDESLKSRADEAATQQASSQIHDSLALAGLPDLRVDNVGCGERFCRASFSQPNGERPAVHDLFGAPPFTGEGFTVEEPDGRIAIYFGRNGATIRDFRSEALAAASP
jgi:hypothetical protein